VRHRAALWHLCRHRGPRFTAHWPIGPTIPGGVPAGICPPPCRSGYR
jgi:hypothetical protein